MLSGLPRPERSYLVCATARSGSTLVCRALASTGVAGVPLEFFEARRETGRPPSPLDYLGNAPGVDLAALQAAGVPEVPDYSDVRSVHDYRDHLRAVLHRGTTANGVFGAKLMWMQVSELTALAHSIPELRGMAPRALFDSLFPSLTYVWVRRDDSVRQAISLWRALQTQAWRSGGYEPKPACDLSYSFAAIHRLRTVLERDDRAWASFFARERLRPVVLEFEQIVAAPAHAVGGVLDALGIDHRDGQPPHPATQRQSDGLSDEWAARYAEDTAATSASWRA